MRIGITTDNTGLESIVSDKFADCKYLLIVNMNDYAFCNEVDIVGVTVIKNKEHDSGFGIVQELIDFDCEAVITGKLEQAIFDKIADACITRFNGAGYQASVALERMERSELNLIRNIEGTDGCNDSHHKY